MEEPQPSSQSAPPPRPKHRSYVNPSRTFAALQFPNYRLWFIGQLSSLVGTWMQSTAQGYLVYELTQSPAFLGYVGLASGLPTWLFTLFGGVLSDRVSRRKLLIMTQGFAMLLAFILAALVFTKTVQPWHIIVLAFLLGVANAFEAPARQSFVVEMVNREFMGNAIALNAAMFNLAMAVGPAFAGIMYASLGPAWCFTINGISFIFVIIALAMMKIKPLQAVSRAKNPLLELKEGFSYVLRTRTVMLLIALMGVVSFFGLSFITLIPAWAVEVLNGNATINGLLQSSRGIGALIAALIVASLGTTAKRGKLLTIGSIAFPIALIIFSSIRNIPLSLITLLFVGWAFMTTANLANALVQSTVPDNLRGRVMGIYSFIFLGMYPLGSGLAGQVAERFSTPAAVLVSASVTLVVALGVALFAPSVRRMR